MKRTKRIITLLLAALMLLSALPTASASDMFENSDFIEKEQPELTAETKQLISQADGGKLPESPRRGHQEL